MSHPHQPDEHGRTTGGVRGAINDLLGRGDNADRTDRDRTADDRTAESERPEQERSGAGADAGLPTGARFDGQPTEGRPAADPRPTGQDPAEAPTGARFEGQPAGARATADPRAAQQPLDASTDAGFDDRSSQQQPDDHRRSGGAGVVGAAAPGQHGLGDPADTTPGSARHTDMGADGPGYTAPAGARTVDVGRADADRAGVDRSGTDPAAATGPVATDRTAGDHTARHDGSGSPAGAAATTPAGSGAGAVAQTSQGEDSSGRERLVSTERAESYGSRWDAVKGQFVDEPRKAVADADALVGELLDELQTLFTEQRKGIERSMAADETSTEDMRLALRRYRSFFDRLLSI
jgi:hypothetical protein